MGWLGLYEWYRCRVCGLEFSHLAEEEILEDHERVMMVELSPYAATVELADLLVTDRLDDVDCSSSTIVDRNQRAGELVDLYGANEHLAAAMAEFELLKPGTCYCSGFPYHADGVKLIP
jgi:hypothetical protein